MAYETTVEFSPSGDDEMTYEIDARVDQEDLPDEEPGTPGPPVVTFVGGRFPNGKDLTPYLLSVLVDLGGCQMQEMVLDRMQSDREKWEENAYERARYSRYR